jgi:hypothetical protein
VRTAANVSNFIFANNPEETKKLGDIDWEDDRFSFVRLTDQKLRDNLPEGFRDVSEYNEALQDEDNIAALGLYLKFKHKPRHKDWQRRYADEQYLRGLINASRNVWQEAADEYMAKVGRATLLQIASYLKDKVELTVGRRVLIPYAKSSRVFKHVREGTKDAFVSYERLEQEEKKEIQNEE